MIAYTLGHRARYDILARLGGEKAPGGYAFASKEDALAYAKANREETSGMGVYAIELPGSFEESTTDDYEAASVARHAWHAGKMHVMPQCGVCRPREVVLTCRLLLVPAPLVTPEVRLPVSAHG